MKKLSTNVAVSLLIAVLPVAAPAASFEIVGSVDISGGYAGDMFGPIEPSTVTLAVGDVVTLTYYFEGGYKLRLSDTPNGAPSFTRVSPWLGFTGTPCGVITICGNFTIANWSIELLGATSNSGTAPTSFSGASQGSCCNHLGSDGFFELSDGDSLEFNGITTTFVITSLPANPNTYNAIRTRYFANNISVIAPVAVEVEINPGKRSNCNNQKPTVIYGSAEFNVAQIDINSLTFEERLDGGRSPRCRVLDSNDDGYPDMVCRFVPGYAEAVLGGNLEDGTIFRGSDLTCAAN